MNGRPCDIQASGRIELYFYGELDAPARLAVDAHLDTCAECRLAIEELSLIRAVLAGRPDVSAPPAGDWGPFMARLEQRVDREGEAGLSAAGSPAAARGGYMEYLAMAAMLALVTASVGYLAGRRAAPVAPPAPAAEAPAPLQAAVPSPSADVSADDALRAVSEQHFERSKLVVLGLTTKDPHGTAPADWAYERQLAGSLLSDTRLYKRAAEDHGLTKLAGVMSDLELVLLQTSLSDDRDAETLERLQRLIRRRDLMTKMEVLETTKGF